VLRTAYQHVDLREGKNTVKVSFTNTSDTPRTVTATAEGPADLQLNLTGDGKFEIGPDQTATALLEISLPDAATAPPGFYHAFVRFDAGDGLLSYGWIEARKAGAPKLDPQTSADVIYSGDVLGFDFNRPLAVVYPVNCSVMELEAAWVIYQTLESATGRVVDIFQEDDLPADVKKRGGMIWVGKGKGDKPTITRNREQLIVSGKTPEETTLAAMDLTLRYWKTAKDSGAAKVGLVAEATDKGGVKTDLD
jgi:hypothetical protein